MTHTNSMTSTFDENIITVAFAAIPDMAIRNQLKSHGFAYNGKKQHWTAQYSAEREIWLSDKAQPSFRNEVFQGDCLKHLASLSANSVDCVLTDPPYLISYKDRSGRSIANDDNDVWVAPLFDELYRVLKDNSFCITFCALPSIVAFMQAAQSAGFRSIGQLIWPKRYSTSRYHLAFKHEQALVFAKGKPAKPEKALSTIQKWHYSGNELHPTQKHTDVLKVLIEHFTKEGDLVLDPFCGSGSTLVAAKQLSRHYIGMELDESYVKTALERLEHAI